LHAGDGVRCRAALIVLAVTAGPAAGQVAIRPEVLPDLEPELLTDDDLEAEADWHPGLQRGRLDGAFRDGTADVDAAVGASAGAGTRLVLSGAAGTRDARAAYGALGGLLALGLGSAKGMGVDLAIRGALERSTIDYRPSPMPMRPAGSRYLRSVDGEAWFALRRGDGGWAFSPAGFALEDIRYGLPGGPLGTAPLDRARTWHYRAAYGYRLYDDKLPDATFAARADISRTALTTDGTERVVQHVTLALAADGATTSGTPMAFPIIGTPGVGLGFSLVLGQTWMEHRMTGQTDKIFSGRIAVSGAGPHGGTGGVGFSVGPGATPDGAYLARLWRVEARYGTSYFGVCGSAHASLSWLEPLEADPTYATVSEHQLGARVTYRVHPFIRVGGDYRVTHHGAWDTAYDYEFGGVVELGGFAGPAVCE
jgi:hypothetical protein